jgi:hypothetical protein
MNYGCKYYMSKQMLCLLLMFQTKRNWKTNKSLKKIKTKDLIKIKITKHAQIERETTHAHKSKNLRK